MGYYESPHPNVERKPMSALEKKRQAIAQKRRMLSQQNRQFSETLVELPRENWESKSSQNRTTARRIAAAADPKIPPSEIRHFAITILDPPRTAKDLVIDFAVEPGAAKAVKAALKTPAAHADPELSLRGAQDAPAEADAAGHEPSGHETGAPPPSDSHEPAHHE